MLSTTEKGLFRNNILVRTAHKFTRIKSESSPFLVEKEVNAGLNDNITVIYSDDDIVVVDKPAFAQTAPGFVDKDSVATRIATLFNISRVDHMIVHRLDYATSGVLVFARNPEALKNLHNQFRSSDQIFKEYIAIVDGRVLCWEGEVELPLGKDLIRGPPFCRVVPFVDPEQGKY